MKTFALAAWLWFLSVGVALAQGGPGPGPGPQPTPSPFIVSGATITAPVGSKLVSAASTAAIAGSQLQCGTAPTSPANGDMWCTTVGFFGRINGATVGPFSSVSTGATNTFTAPQVVDLGSGTSEPAASAGATWESYGADGAAVRDEITAFNNSVSGAVPVFDGRASLGTRASPSAVISGTLLASFEGKGYDTSVWTGTGASFHVYAEGTFSPTSHPGEACLATAASGATATADWMCVHNDGGATIGSPTGSDEGAGTLNAVGLFVNGAAVMTNATGVASVGNFSADSTLTIAGTGSGPWTGVVTIKCTHGSASQIGCLEVGTGLSVTGGVASVTNPSPSTSVSGDVVTFSNATGALSDSGTLLAALAPIASPTFTGTATFAAVLGSGRTVSGTTDTLAATDCGTQINYTSGSSVTVTIPETLPVHCNIAVAQIGAGRVAVNGSAVTPATLESADSFTGTAAQWAIIGLNIEANVGGSAAVAVLTGRGS